MCPCCPTCPLVLVHQLLSDRHLQVEVVVLLVRALQIQGNVLEDQDVFGLVFLFSDTFPVRVGQTKHVADPH